MVILQILAITDTASLFTLGLLRLSFFLNQFSSLLLQSCAFHLVYLLVHMCALHCFLVILCLVVSSGLMCLFTPDLVLGIFSFLLMG